MRSNEINSNTYQTSKKNKDSNKKMSKKINDKLKMKNKKKYQSTHQTSKKNRGYKRKMKPKHFRRTRETKTNQGKIKKNGRTGVRSERKCLICNMTRKNRVSSVLQFSETLYIYVNYLHTFSKENCIICCYRHQNEMYNFELNHIHPNLNI